MNHHLPVLLVTPTGILCSLDGLRHRPWAVNTDGQNQSQQLWPQVCPVEQVRGLAVPKNGLGARTSPDIQTTPMPGQPGLVGISWVLKIPFMISRCVQVWDPVVQFPPGSDCRALFHRVYSTEPWFLKLWPCQGSLKDFPYKKGILESNIFGKHKNKSKAVAFILACLGELIFVEINF